MFDAVSQNLERQILAIKPTNRAAIEAISKIVLPLVYGLYFHATKPTIKNVGNAVKMKLNMMLAQSINYFSLSCSV